MQLQPYLFFNGNCEQALEFYRQALGAQVLMLMRFRDAPTPPPPGTLQPGFEDKVMHAQLRVGDVEFMASDGCSSREASFNGFALSLAFPDEAGARRAFAALAESGTVDLPIGATFWSPCFGMVHDRFGLQWMITVPSPPPG